MRGAMAGLQDLTTMAPQHVPTNQVWWGVTCTSVERCPDARPLLTSWMIETTAHAHTQPHKHTWQEAVLRTVSCTEHTITWMRSVPMACVTCQQRYIKLSAEKPMFILADEHRPGKHRPGS